MPPLTRSSAPSTPAKSPASTASVSPSSTGTRRTPHCRKCHRPRAGHPRSGCPYFDPSDPTPSSPSTSRSTSTTAQLVHTADGLSEELSSLRIVSPTEETRRRSMPPTGDKSKRRLSVRFALVPEQTLASLGPTDTHLVEQLLQPGLMNNTVTPEDKVAHVVEWRKTLNDADPSDDGPRKELAEPPSMLSRRMPCTLLTPTASLTITEPVSDQYIGGSAVNMDETIYLLPDAPKPIPLGRSLSFEQRSLFLHRLSHASSMAPATLFSLPPADVDNVRSDAEKIGFHVRVLPGQEDNNKWVILGTEEEAINLLAQKFLEEEERSTKVKGQGTKLTAVAGGVVFGAVATWTGLAFS